ncbi:MAG: hypothetical protein COT74_01650 [Bdellovibrionales bacterium CG10_big_fil_rev_8_21_14_0_10_45_34]|nr:MAG: hypothetical protein COT74_01650 [Bdellovibrionales bacterium CG10_big_fil_rev_8_21_14_0_10_45_34]
MFHEEKFKLLPWDYFLSDYERDLLKMPIQDLVIKYPRISQEQIEAELITIRDNVAIFNSINQLHIS